MTRKDDYYNYSSRPVWATNFLQQIPPPQYQRRGHR